MKVSAILLPIVVAINLGSGVAVAGPKNKHWMPPGLAKKGGMPPGIAKKYALGQRIPHGIYVPVEARYRASLPYDTPAGRRWVRVGQDLYLLSAATGTIVDVIHGWLR